jgi:hypothetical protein
MYGVGDCVELIVEARAGVRDDRRLYDQKRTYGWSGGKRSTSWTEQDKHLNKPHDLRSLPKHRAIINIAKEPFGEYSYHRRHSPNPRKLRHNDYDFTSLYHLCLQVFMLIVLFWTSGKSSENRKRLESF